MNNAYKEYALSKCETEIYNCKEYQELNKTIIDIERLLRSKLSGEDLELFVKYTECSCRQSVIYTEKLIKILNTENL